MQTTCALSSPTRPGRRRPHRRSGFSLVEVAIAFSILALALCSALLTLASGYKSLDTARCSTLAAQLMQSEIETLRLANWDTLKARADDSSLSHRVYTQEELKAMLPSEVANVVERFSLEQNVALDAARADMLLISMTVTWKSANGAPHSRIFSTRYSKDGLYDYYHTHRS